jgi:hypothetical protein
MNLLDWRRPRNAFFSQGVLFLRAPILFFQGSNRYGAGYQPVGPVGGRALTSSEGTERTGFRFCVAYVARPTAMMSCLVAREPHRVIFETAPVNAESPKLRSASNGDYRHE